MAGQEIRVIRDCVNPAIATEFAKSQDGWNVSSVRIDGAHAAFKSPPPEIWVDGIRYAPVAA